MTKFTLRPISNSSKYLKVIDLNLGRKYLQVTDLDPRPQFADSVIFESNQTPNSNVLSPDTATIKDVTSGVFIYIDTDFDSYGASYTKLTPETNIASQFNIQMIDENTCYILSNYVNGTNPFVNYNTSCALSYWKNDPNTYFSKSPAYPDQKLWYIDIVE